MVFDKTVEYCEDKNCECCVGDSVSDVRMTVLSAVMIMHD